MSNGLPEDTLTTATRTELAQHVTRLFSHWQLSPSEQLSLLGLRDDQRHTLYRYRRGQPIANLRDRLDRVRLLLDIHRCLRLLFPQNRDLAYTWIRQPNRAFEGMPPVAMVQAWGITGLLRIHTYLKRQLG